MDLMKFVSDIDWKKVYIAQYGSRDEIRACIRKKQLVVIWSNDNGYHTTAEGIDKMLYKNGALAFVPNVKANKILNECGYYTMIAKETAN